MVTVFFVAVVLAVVPYPMVSFYLILFVLFLSAVLYRVGPSEPAQLLVLLCHLWLAVRDPRLGPR